MVKIIDGVEVHYEDYRGTDVSADIIVTSIFSSGVDLVQSLPLEISEILKNNYRELILKGE